jgi:hypothetical protein
VEVMMVATDIVLRCTLNLTGKDVPVPAVLTLGPDGGCVSVTLRIEFAPPGRAMWLASWFDASQVREFAEALEQVHAGRASGAGLWDQCRMLLLHLEAITEAPGTVGLSVLSCDHWLGGAGLSTVVDPGEELPELFDGEMVGFRVAFQGLLLPVPDLPALASAIRQCLDSSPDALPR